MKVANTVKELIDKQNISMRAFSKKIDMPYTTLLSMLNRGMSNAGINNVKKICVGLGITVDELLDLANNQDDNNTDIKDKANPKPTMTAAHNETGEEYTAEELKMIEEAAERARQLIKEDIGKDK